MAMFPAGIWSAAARGALSSPSRDAQLLGDADAAIRQAVPTSRRIAVVSVASGSGCSTVAAALATRFASARGGRVLAVDGGGAPGLAALIGSSEPEPASADAPAAEPAAAPAPAPRAARRHGRTETVLTSWDATAGLPRSRAGAVLAAPGAERAATAAEWALAVDPIARYFDVVIGDWGTRTARVDVGAAVAGAHAVLVVAHADRGAVEAAVAVADGIRTHRGIAALVVADDVRDAGPDAARAADAWGGARVAYLPHDGRGHGRPGVASPAFQRAAVLLAGEAMTAAAGRRPDDAGREAS